MKKPPIEDGSGRENRRLPPMENGYIQVDELSFNDLLAMAADYSRLCKFYNLNNSPDGDWEPFFTADEAVIIAMIETDDVKTFESRFSADYTTSRENRYYSFLLLSLYNYRLAEKIDFWYKNLHAIDSPAARGLAANIEKVIQKRLISELHFLKKTVDRYNNRYGFSIKVNFGTFSKIWGMEEGREEKNGSRNEDIEEIKEGIKSNFQAFYNAILYIKKTTLLHLSDSLTTQTHNPFTGLYIAFLKLFQHAQKELNHFTLRHQHFYYDDVLHVTPRGPVVDSAYLIFTPDAKMGEREIKKGTEFIAGKDANRRDLFFTADNDLLVTSGQVETLYALYRQRNRLTFPGGDKGITGIKTTDIPIVEKIDTSSEEETVSWAVLGEPRRGVKQPFSGEAHLGFAVSSPVLLLGEGERNVTVTFHIRPSKGETGGKGLEANIGSHAEWMEIGKKEAFYKIFDTAFTLCITTEKGWAEVPEYTLVSSIIDEKCESNCLKFTFTLTHTFDPVVPYSPEIHGGKFETSLPLLRFLINPQAYLYPYSILKDLIVDEIAMEADVKEVKRLLLYNNIGQLDPNTLFSPFGPLPSVGSYLIIGNHEIAQKDITRLSVNIQWGQLPLCGDGFQEHYQGYETPFDNSVFEGRISMLSDGKWLPPDEEEQPMVKLFTSEQRQEEFGFIQTNKVSKDIRLSWSGLEDFKPLDRLLEREEFTYDMYTRGGFIKVTLSTPPYSFGHQDYSQLLTKVLTKNAKLKNVLPVPNPPYTPVINAISIDYGAESTVNRLFHIHPFGFEEVYPKKGTIDTPLLPRYDCDGNLYIGLSGIESGVITLFFHMRQDSSQKPGGSPPPILWSYLSGNRWKRLEKERIISDTTHGFLSTGIVTIRIPAGIDPEHTILPAKLLWLRASANSDLESLCSAYLINTQAIKVTRHDQGGSGDTIEKGLPAGSIKNARRTIPGIREMYQPVDSFNGRGQESNENLQTRIAERLRHKNRATTPWDYERIILERFPEISKVKCFSNMSIGQWQKPHPGHLLIAVLPCQNGDAPQFNHEPMVNYHVLQEINNFVAAMGSPFIKVEVRNPIYEKIQVRLTAKFKTGATGGYYLKKLKEAITHYLSPWQKTGYTARFGWRVRRSDIESYLRDIDYLDYITNFSMLHITDHGNSYYTLGDTIPRTERNSGNSRGGVQEIGPLFPWSIAISDSKHFIETMGVIKPMDAEPTGINELKIGNTFIVS